MILVALGSNTQSRYGPPAATVRAAIEALGRPPVGADIVSVSRLFSSPAWPDPSDPPYVNAVVAIRTALTPTALMAALHEAEAAFGRERRARNAPRTLDLDIVDFNGQVEALPGGPILPHPRAHERAFVLAPLLDVAPDWRHPVTGVSGQVLLAGAQAAGSLATPLG